MMNPVSLAVAAGIVGTLLMDVANHALARAGVLVKIDMAMIGRMAAGWAHGRFRYRDPGEMEASDHERWLGYFTHYAISIVFALVYVLGWHYLIGGTISAVWALVYGAATTAASQLLVFPSLGLGVCGHRSPHGVRAPLSSMVNHMFFGAGVAATIFLGQALGT